MGKYTEEDIIRGKKTLKNGMLAGYVRTEEGHERFRIIGVDPDNNGMGKLKASAREKRPGYRSPLNEKQAGRAFNRYYKKKEYKTASARASAKRRDLCWNNQETVSDRRYARSPHRYDYDGVDDGSDDSCEGVHKYKKGAKLNHLKKGTPEALEWHQRMVSARGKSSKSKKSSPKKKTSRRGSKRGGGKRPVSLKTAVRLLRQYYTEKYA